MIARIMVKQCLKGGEEVRYVEGKIKVFNSDAPDAEKNELPKGTGIHQPDAGVVTMTERQTACYRCGKASKELKKCGGCKTAAYCSKGYQEAEWKAQKQLCTPIAVGKNKKEGKAGAVHSGATRIWREVGDGKERRRRNGSE
jgi:hypothetical protein